MQNFDPVTVTVALPVWAVGVVGAVVVGLCLLAFARAGRGGIVGAISRVVIVVVGGVAAWAAVETRMQSNLAAQRAELDRRVNELSARSLAPGSALACLDEQAGDAVGASCERALFATPESTAAAVSYVTAQLSLLAEANDYVNSSGENDDAALASLRHAVEEDRFGIVAHVLAVRDGCKSEQCGAFAMLHNITRVSDNLTESKYEFYVRRHAAEWPAAPATGSPFVANLVPPSFINRAPPPAATNAVPPSTNNVLPPSAVNVLPPTVGPNPPPSPGTTIARGTPANKLFFPSSSSIPPVSIMNAEPGPPTSASGAGAETNTKPPPRKPPAQARQPANQNGQTQAGQQARQSAGQNQNQNGQPQTRPPPQQRPAPPETAD